MDVSSVMDLVCSRLLGSLSTKRKRNERIEFSHNYTKLAMLTFLYWLIDHFQCILITRTLYKIVNIVNFVYNGKTRMVYRGTRALTHVFSPVSATRSTIGSTSFIRQRDLLLNGSFPPTETDSDSKSYRYIVLCTTFSTGLDSDPCMDNLPTGYCTHFRDGSPSRNPNTNSPL